MTLGVLSELRMPDREPWSMYPGRRASASGGDVVVLVPPDAPLGLGFERAQRELAGGNPRVRIIGRGISLAERWPEWVHSATGLVVTEPDAYLPCERTRLTAGLAVQLGEWLADVFHGAIDDVRPERALWGSAMLRVFHPALASWPLVLGLVHHHGRDRIVCTDPTWIGVEALSCLVNTAGGECGVPSRGHLELAFPLRLAMWGIFSAGAAIGVRLYEYVKERPSRERVRKLRAETGGTPSIWIGIFGDWPRVTRHVIEGVGQAAGLRGERIGVLLYGSLRPGLRREDSANGQSAAVVFPALEHPALLGNIGAVEQCVSVEKIGTFISNGAASIVRSARVLFRITRRGRVVKLGEMPIDLEPRIRALARLATFDVLRANEAVIATRALLRRRSFNGARIVWPHASLTVEAVPDLLFQAAGVTTYDLVHGSMYDTMELVTFDRTFSTVKVLWTEAEERVYAPFTGHQECAGGYTPRVRDGTRRGARARGPGEPIHILALTNYLCGKSNADHPPRLECYQHAFFRALCTATRSLGRTEVRWRPHPSDSRSRVQEIAMRYASLNMGLSLDPPGLGEALAWADVVVTSMSSIIVEALDYSLPILVHEIPFLDPAGVLSFFPLDQRFHNGDELAERLRSCAEAIEGRTSDALPHEFTLERELFGQGRQSLAQLFWPR